MKNSTFLSIKWKDVLKGFITAVITAILMAIYPLLQGGGTITLDQLKASGLIGLTAGVGYLIKNVFTNSNDQFLKKEPTE